MVPTMVCSSKQGEFGFLDMEDRQSKKFVSINIFSQWPENIMSQRFSSTSMYLYTHQEFGTTGWRAVHVGAIEPRKTNTRFGNSPYLINGCFLLYIGTCAIVHFTVLEK